jgi:hypothetical protein
LQSACVETFEEGSDCWDVDEEGCRKVMPVVACEQLLVAAVTVSVRRKSGSVKNVGNKKEKSVHLLKNSRQRVMKAFLEKGRESTPCSDERNMVFVGSAPVRRRVVRMLRRWWLKAERGAWDLGCRRLRGRIIVIFALRKARSLTIVKSNGKRKLALTQRTTRQYPYRGDIAHPSSGHNVRYVFVMYGPKESLLGGVGRMHRVAARCL